MTVDRRLVRAGARATLALGIAASLAANVLAAEATLIGRTIAAWPPVALLVTVELLARVPAADGWRSRLRVVAAAGIAGIAAWVSYWHMVAVALEHGEESLSAHLLPLSVDGLIVVASICLLELGRHEVEVAVHSPVEAPLPVPVPTSAPEPVRVEVTPPRPAPVKVERSTVEGSPRAKAQRLLLEHPDWTIGQVAEAASCSPGTVKNAKRDLELHAKARTNGHLVVAS